MKRIATYLSDQNKADNEIYILLLLLPPPISLDLLCNITGRNPVEVLQIVEELVRCGDLLRCPEKGAGYYHLSDFKAAAELLARVPPATVFDITERAIAIIREHLPDCTKRWTLVAHLYQISGLPVEDHFADLIRSGHYCLGLNLTSDAATYYRMALEGMDKADLDRDGRQGFIDATIGLCTCLDNALHTVTQREYLTRALEYSESFGDSVQTLRLRVLLARTFFRMANADEAVKQLERTRPMMDQDDLPKEVRSQVVLANAEFLFWQGHINEAIKLYESVLGQYQELPRDVEMLKGFVKMGWTYGAAGETDRGVDLIMAVRERARELQARDLERYATLIQVIILADAGRIDEGQSLLEEVFSTPEEYLDHYTLWPGNGKRAYFAFLRGEHKKAFQYLCKAWENSLAMGTPHHRGPDNLEIMLDLEEEGLIHPEWNFDSDVERLLKWPDAYMRGVAYRFRAQKRLRRAEASEAVKADLQTSMDLLAESGAKLELANTRVQMARVLIAENKVPAAEKLLRSAWEVYSRVNPNLFPRDMEAYLDRTSKNALWVESLLAIGDALGSMLTKKEFLGQIINQAMRIASAERGVVFLKQDGKLEMVSNRNLGLPETCPETCFNQMEMIEKVLESGVELIEKTEDSPSPGTEGTGGWVGCFPIRVKARVLGVIFLDCRLAQSRLPENEISLLRIISNQAAVTLENLEAHEVEADLEGNLEAEAQFYRETYEGGLPKGHMIGRSKPFKKMMMLINQVAKSDATVMITGETGVGKELVAQAIHQGSARSSGPFIAVNMVSLSPELMASELFGHEKGAFTGASQTRKGRFELASEGTLFLDDIDTFSLDIQAKMLRVLETREFERVGGTRTLKTSFRLVAASNRDIEELVEQGLFRSDFYYRLNVFPIKVPPLRERAEDIPVLAHYFMKMFGKKFGKVFDNISRKDLRHLLDYHWPGNLRELRHVIERAVLLGENGRLVIPSLDMSPVGGNDDEVVLPLKEMEARHIVKALAVCRGKISGPGGAAQLLEVKPTTLYSKMKNLGVRREEFTIEKRSYN